MAADFAGELARHGLAPLRRGRVRTLQVNLGRRCNLACHHCHVEAGPRRREALDEPGVRRVLELLERNEEVECLDLTGGAPELHPAFRRLVRGASALGRRVIDRCNLTVFFEPGHGDLPEFLADQGAAIVASLPCYELENVDRQRGRGVFEDSIRALRWLNRVGYGKEGSHLALDLVHNPVGASLPPSQAALELRYRDELRARFGIEFHRLLTLTNMPIRRFARELAREGRTEAYMRLLVDHFNPATVPGLMCRELLSIGFDGRVYDCDFNQMLGLPLGAGTTRLADLEDLRALEQLPIATAAHCFGCTAGAGSSCGGSLV
jgi:radical SAM/Cys-rich protein